MTHFDPERGGPPRGQECVSCLAKYRQHASGRCRSCEREAEEDRLRILALADNERHEKREAMMSDSLLARALHLGATWRTVTVDGVEYFVVWDGSMDGPAGREQRVLVQ